MGGLRYDVAIIGSGPGGHAAALAARALGKEVVVIDRRFIGEPLQNGTGVLALQSLRSAARIHAAPRIDPIPSMTQERGIFDEVRRRARQAMQRAMDELCAADIHLVEGDAEVTGPHSLKVRLLDGQTRDLGATHIVIATGSRARPAPSARGEPGLALDLSSLFTLHMLPESLTMVGNGYVAAELASVFGHLGTKVHLVDNRRPLLPSFDRECVEGFLSELRRANVTFHQDCEVMSYTEDVASIRMSLSNNEVIHSEKLVFALGRTGYFGGLGLANVGVTTTSDVICVDEHFQTSIPSIYAIGDVIGRPRQAAVARWQGQRVIDCIYRPHVSRAAQPPPLALYAIPEVAQVGETEKAAKSKRAHVIVGRSRTEDIAHSLGGSSNGTVKLVFDGETQQLIGASLTGDGAVDLIHFCQLAVLQKLTARDLVELVFLTPTRAEAIQRAASTVLGSAKTLHRAA